MATETEGEPGQHQRHEQVRLGAGSGPLRGVKVVEIAGIGPGPHACTILADLGADVIRVDRPGGQPIGGGRADLINRGRPSIAVDLKHPDGVATVRELVRGADILIEGMRPGVTERLGLGPEECHELNPALVYGRMTGWGQDGPLSAAAGHDLTYIATTGVLYGLGQDGAKPHFPTNLLGDFGGGSTYLVIGVLAALLEAKTSGRGQVVDAAIVDGTSHLHTMVAGMLGAGLFQDRRGANLLDGGAPFYDLYATSDGRHVAVGALEPQFFAALLDVLGLSEECPEQYDLARWGEMRDLFARTLASRTMAQWAEAAEGTDACLAPVLTYEEARTHPHIAARGIHAEVDGVLQPAPAPKFSRTRPTLGRAPAETPGADTRAALEAWGIADVPALIDSGAVVQH